MKERNDQLLSLIILGKAREKANLGWCRIWSDVTLDEIERWGSENSLIISAEAREIRLSSGIEHTFVRVQIENEPALILDGTGVENYLPYFGTEADAPPHLQNSRPDRMIMTARRHRFDGVGDL